VQKFLDPAFIEAKLIEITVWIQTNILSIGTLLQFLVIILAFVIAWVVAIKLRAWLESDWDFPWYEQYCRVVSRALAPLSMPVIWLALQWFSVFAAENAKWPHHLITIVVSLLTAWVIIRLGTALIRSPQWSRVVAITAWTIAALSITGLLGPTIAVLDSMALQLGEVRISILGVIKAGFALAVLLWLASSFSGLVERRLTAMPGISPTAGVLFGKVFRIVLVTIALLVGLDSVGIDLTAFAVFSGAIGLGIGFGLQKVFSNLISGMILLMDRSVKPGDVIAVGQSFGWINALQARYVSVITRDGIEHLIPNEELISQRVENWSHSHKQVRLRMPIGIDYGADVHKAMELTVKAANEVDRVLSDPAPVCRLMGFGDNAVDLELRMWITDPQAGVANITSAVLLRIWDLFAENGIDFPFPQRDLHIKSSIPFRLENQPNTDDAE
jgi:small-conductance mechanosensitive channel